MRILMLSWEYPPNQVGGLSRHVFHLSQALARAGVEVQVLTPAVGHAPAREERGNLRICRSSIFFSNAPDFATWVMHGNFGLLQEGARYVSSGHPPDLIHAHDWLVAYAARGLKHLSRLPLISTIHATERGRQNGLHHPGQRYINDIEWWLTYESWRVVCCSHSMEGEVQRNFGLPADKLRVVPNGVEAPPAPGAARRTRPREDFAHPRERIILHVGRLVPEKGAGHLVEALPMILAQCPDAKLIIAGTGPWSEELRHRARGLGVEAKVYLTGYVDDATLDALYRWAEVAVFPSTYEPFGIVALEAMARGTPVVVTDVGGLAEIVAHEADGLKAFPSHPRSLADQISRLLRDPALRERQRQAALLKVARQYTWDRVAALSAEVYAEVLEESRRTARRGVVQ